MNCFNIRELQGILKRKFFTDLINTSDFRGLTNQTLIGSRYKQHSSLSNMADMSILYNYGITTSSKSKFYNFRNIYDQKMELFAFNNFKNIFNYSLFEIFSNTVFLLKSNLFFLFELLKVFVLSFKNLSMFLMLDNYTSVINNFFKTLSLNMNLTDLMSFRLTLTSIDAGSELRSSILYKSENINLVDEKVLESQKFSELSNNFRFIRFYNPIISYDYKTGNYIGQWESLYPSLITSYIEVARNIRKAS
jgi:hypothetical protein